MDHVATPEQLVALELNEDDVRGGIEYGIISWGHTYDRMRWKNVPTSINRIAVGRAAESCLARWLRNRNVISEVDRTHFTQTDRSDFKLDQAGHVDVKTVHVYTNFVNPDRPAFDPAAVAHAESWDNWRGFFPMLIPKDQWTRIPKDAYCFAILFSNSPLRPRHLIFLPNPSF